MTEGTTWLRVGEVVYGVECTMILGTPPHGVYHVTRRTPHETTKWDVSKMRGDDADAGFYASHVSAPSNSVATYRLDDVSGKMTQVGGEVNDTVALWGEEILRGLQASFRRADEFIASLDLGDVDRPALDLNLLGLEVVPWKEKTR